VDLTALRNANPEHWTKAAAIRALALDAVAAANSGHTGMPIGMADVATVLFEKHMKFDVANPKWPDRDRFILSAGHGSMLIYSLLYLMGDAQVTLEQIKNFRQMGALTAGHPENFLIDAVETTTGPLGQGIANAVGFAMAEEMQRAQYGRKLVDHHTYVIAGDGCLMEGVSQEAIGLAGRHSLGKLIVLWDNNNITIDGTVELSDRTNQVQRFKASGWHVQEIDGHDPKAIDAAIEAAKKTKKPSMIACKTHIALGHAAQDTSKGHGALTDAEQLKAAKDAYGWTGGAFEVPAGIKAQWEAIGQRGAAEREAWEARFAEASQQKQDRFNRAYALDAPKKLSAAVKALKKQVSEDQPKVATRKASEMALAVINPLMPETVGGSADLTGSNNTKTGDLGIFDTDNRKGRYVYWGIREHGMASAMNGMALHGGIRPYGGTFFCFTICRATPNTYVFRPADAVETAEAWEIALTEKETPSVMTLTRQNLPTVRTEHKLNNLTSKGAYVLAEAEGKRQVILIATGSEVSVAMDAKAKLEAEGIGTRVVSMPCMELFAQQDEAYRRKVLPAGPVRVGIEAAMRAGGWDRWLLGERGQEKKAAFVGMDRFGASAPAGELFEKFGITSDNTVAKVKELLG
jgi:transketolase